MKEKFKLLCTKCPLCLKTFLQWTHKYMNWLAHFPWQEQNFGSDIFERDRARVVNIKLKVLCDATGKNKFPTGAIRPSIM
jgi:hypothetical protein